jgi:hypothetical protein
MDWKLVSAFATGAVLASGIVYFAVRPEEVATKPAVTKPAAPKALSPPLPPQIAATPAPHVAHARPPETPVREKPSPMPPPVRRERPVTVARYEPPPRVSTPAPASVAPPATVPAPNVPLQNVSLPTPAPKAEVRVPHVVTLVAGTSLAVRIGETVSSARYQPGDRFTATLTQPLVLDGFIIAERGARVEGKVVDAAPAGRWGGTSHLAISVVQVSTSDGQDIRIRTEPFTKDGFSPAAEIPVETRINFRVQDSLTITERLN